MLMVATVLMLATVYWSGIGYESPQFSLTLTLRLPLFNQDFLLNWITALCMCTASLFGLIAI